jgi:hypothetical protein
MTMAVMNPVTFVTDSMAQLAVASGVARVAGIPEEWIELVLSRIIKRWLEALNVGDKVKRRLLNQGVMIDYTIVVPANNQERVTGMGALESIMRAPLTNITKVLRSRLIAAIGVDAGVSITGVAQPSLSVMPYETTTTTMEENTTMRVIATASAPPRPSLHAVVALSAAACSWMYIASLHGS